MQEGIYIAASAGLKQQTKLDIIANNLANVNNAGFKKDGIIFKELIPPFEPDTSFESSRNTLLPADVSNRNVAYVGINEFYTNHSQGNLVQTGNSLDLGLDGEGFFAVNTPQGVRYTRNGNFRLDTNEQLVTQEGYPVLGDAGGPVTIPAQGGNVTIDAAGTVSVGGGIGITAIGQIRAVNFENKKDLVKVGADLYRTADPQIKETPAANVSVRQGFLESSNVNTVEEMTQMISTLRGFEAYQKVIQSIDAADEQSVNNIGRVT